ncbi:hypothetical protein AVEN_63136-1 [Araneus ventricosus]|uniref:Uncharacterized protein n=1 Tax=Araneus ventricosus TaxID=182803 RepID=A0A4Y2G4D1_ARAVE|nr:hypothetical protein AVEN_63136-1 [Araneus ventricosus]
MTDIVRFLMVQYSDRLIQSLTSSTSGSSSSSGTLDAGVDRSRFCPGVLSQEGEGPPLLSESEAKGDLIGQYRRSAENQRGKQVRKLGF